MILPHDVYEEYFAAIHREAEYIEFINSILKNQYNYKKPNLEKIIEAIKQIKPELDAQINRQIGVLIKLMPEPCDIDSLQGLITVLKLPEENYCIVINFLKRIKPHSDSQEDIMAYYEYVNSILNRLIQSNDVRFLAKLDARLPKEGQILIKRTHSDTTIESEKKLNAFQYLPLKIDAQILDCVYKHDMKKFNAYAHSESSIYKRGFYNPNKSQIITLTIKLDAFTKGHLFLGISKEKKKDVIHYYMAPNFAIIGHEEIHGFRMLRGASRGGEESILPTILQLAYDNPEEYFNIQIGKSSEALLSQIYGLPKRIGHIGFEFTSDSELSKETSAWQEKLLIGIAAHRLALPSKMDLRHCNKQILKKLSASGCTFKDAKIDKNVKDDIDSNIKLNKKIKKYTNLSLHYFMVRT